MSKIDNPMAKADPPDDLRQTIADALHDEKTIRGYGRRQHGLNGKDADLDSTGQCVVKALYVYDDKKGTYLGADLLLYADVCPASDDDDEDLNKELGEMSEAIVMDGIGYSGEWSDDYWYFDTEVRVKCEITDEEYDDDTLSNEVLDTIAERLVTAINEVPEVRAFERAMASLHSRINSLHDFGQNDTPEQMGWVGADGRP